MAGIRNLGTLLYTVGAKNQQFKQTMQDSSREIERLEQRAEQSRKNLQKWGAAITAMSVAVAGFTSKMAGDFEHGMKTVQTLLGPESTDRIKELEQSVKDMALETGKSFADLTGGLYQVISAFGDSAESAKILEINAKGAAAGLASTLDAINLTSAVTKAYGDTSAEAVQHVTDLAFQTVKLGQTTFPELAASIGTVTPMAAALNIKMEELFGSMATLTGVTGNTSEVTTQLNAALNALIKPTEEMQKALNELGYETGMALIEAEGFQGALSSLHDVVDGNTGVLAEMFGSVRAIRAVLALTGPQAEEFARKTGEMASAAGAADEAFKIMAESVNFMRDQVKQMVNVALLEVGEKFLPLVKSVLQIFLDLPPWVRQAATEFISLATALGLIIGPLMLIKAALPAINAQLAIMGLSFGPLMVGGAVLMGLKALADHFNTIDTRIERNINQVNNLVNEYRELTSQESLSEQEKRRLRTAASELARIYPDLVEGIDSETGALKINTEAVIENVRARNIELMQKQLEARRRAILAELRLLETAKDQVERVMVDEIGITQSKIMVGRILGEIDQISDALKHIEPQEITLELMLELQQDEGFMQALKSLGDEVNFQWNEALKTLITYNQYLGEMGYELTGIEEKNRGLNEELEKTDQKLEKIGQVLSGEMTFGQFEEWLASLQKGQRILQETPAAVETVIEKQLTLADVLKEVNDKVELGRKIAEALGEPFDEATFKVEVLRNKILEMIEQNKAWDDQILVGLTQELQKLLEQGELEKLEETRRELILAGEQAILEIRKDYQRRTELLYAEGLEQQLIRLDHEKQNRLDYFKTLLEEEKISLEQHNELLLETEQYYSQAREKAYQDFRERALLLEQDYFRRLELVGLEGLDLELKRLEQEREAAIENAKNIGADTGVIKEYYKAREIALIDHYATLEEERAQRAAEEVARIEAQKAEEIARINQQLTDQFNQLTMARMDYEFLRLEQQKEIYLQAGADELLITQWYEQAKQEIKDRYYQQELDREMRIVRFKFDMEEIELEQYKEYLEQRLALLEEYSDEWINLMRIMKGLEQETGDDFENTLNNLDYLTQRIAGNITDILGAIIDPAKDLEQTLWRILDQLAQLAIQKLILDPFSDWVGGLVGVAHEGARVTSAGLVRDWPRFHLGVDEVPAILEVGERVLSKDQNKDFEQLMKNQGGIVVINAIDPKSFSEKLREHSSDIAGVTFEQIQNHAVLREVLRRLG